MKILAFMLMITILPALNVWPDPVMVILCGITALCMELLEFKFLFPKNKRDE